MRYYIDKVKYTHASFTLDVDGVSFLRKGIRHRRAEKYAYGKTYDAEGLGSSRPEAALAELFQRGPSNKCMTPFCVRISDLVILADVPFKLTAI